MIEVKAPNPYTIKKPTIFLGGTIEQGRAENWQEFVAAELIDYDVLLLKPRRDDWDSTWIQSIDTPQFNCQVNWELDGLDDADIVLFVFASNESEAEKVKAPITLLELGLHVKDKKCFVCCPDGYWRKGNVDIVCSRNNVKVHSNLNDMLADLKSYLADKYWW